MIQFDWHPVACVSGMARHVENDIELHLGGDALYVTQELYIDACAAHRLLHLPCSRYESAYDDAASTQLSHLVCVRMKEVIGILL